MLRPLAKLLTGSALLLLGACVTIPSPEERLLNVEQLAVASDWRRLDIEVPPFVLAGYLSPSSAWEVSAGDRTLTVYVEGDGLAWRTRTRPALNPSPANPVGLQLALRHPQGRVAYLARPCQFTTPGKSTACERKFWTSHRFSPEVITAVDRALTTLKELTESETLRLVGYSGGGAVAALVAARRGDIVELITVAGNLDHALWTERHMISSLDGSLNPADVAVDLSALPQVHFVGVNDAVMPREIADSFIARQSAVQCAEVVSVASVSHAEGWLEHWVTLLRYRPRCGEDNEKMFLAPNPKGKH